MYLIDPSPSSFHQLKLVAIEIYISFILGMVKAGAFNPYPEKPHDLNNTLPPQAMNLITLSHKLQSWNAGGIKIG